MNNNKFCLYDTQSKNTKYSNQTLLEDNQRSQCGWPPVVGAAGIWVRGPGDEDHFWLRIQKRIQ